MDPKIFVLDLIENNAFIFDVSQKSTNQQGISSRSSKNPSIKQFSSSKNTLFNKYLIGYQWINIFLFWIVYVRLRGWPDLVRLKIAQLKAGVKVWVVMVMG